MTVKDSNNNEYSVTDGVLTITKGTSGSGVMPNFSTNCVTDLSITDTVTSVIVDSGMTTIGNKAFNEMTSITSVTLADTVTSVGTYSFSGCTSLSSIDLGDGLTYIGNYTFQNCSSLTSIDIPDTVNTIGVTAFSGTGLTSVILPSALTSINNSIFFGCTSLVSVTIKANVTAIGNYVFYNCSSLTSIRIQSTTPATVGSNLCPTATNIYVPHGTGSAYRSSWSSYANQIVELPDPIRKMKLMCLDKGENVTSATGNSTQTGTPTPSNPIPVISTTYYDSDGNPVELRKVATYEDTYSNGVITRNVGVKALDGTENWTEYAYETVKSYYFINQDMIETSSSTSSNLFKNTHFEFRPTVWGAEENIGFACSSLKRLFFRRNSTDTLAVFTQWLATQYANGTPIIVYYPLATPTTESKTLTTKYDVKTMKPMFVKSALPDGYTEVEYIQSNGNQYIDTGENTSTDTELEGKIMVSELSNQMLWANNNTATNRISCYLSNTGSCNFGDKTSSNNNLLTYLSTTSPSIIKENSDGIFIDGTKRANFGGGTIAGGDTMYIFTAKNTGAVGLSGKMYYCTIKKNNTLVRDYIPCVYHYGQADAVVGMYDLVTNTFKTNSGTGTFTAGNPVTTRFKAVKAKPILEVIL